MPTNVARRDPSLSRRSFLGLTSFAALGAAGCSGGNTAPPSEQRVTTTSLVSGAPFYVAHRGGGGDWPEMTAYAYQQASAVPGLRAMEISVCLSRDGVLVCSHDPTTTRVTGKPYTIAKQDWSTLAGLQVSAKNTTDPGQPSRPLARFDEIVERYIDRFVLFVEPKVAAAQAPLLARLETLRSPERTVWKQPLAADGFAAAKASGMTTWGYVLDEPYVRQRLSRLARSPDVDMLGIPVRAPEVLVSEIASAAAANGKKTVAWAIANEADRQRALSFGASGLMTSTIRENGPS